mmetsp:Transcript_23446/g.65664  ORF Transcript_23446/g.65664 Transcript_23446/m.65664 type:complete len:373 (+) Transcript_23446:86-1204(+)
MLEVQEKLEGLHASDTTVMLDETVVGQGFAEGFGAAPPREDPVLSLVSLNPKTAATVDIVRGSFEVVPDLPCASDETRTVRISCGRDIANGIVLEDSRVSLFHFTVRVRVGRSGCVALDLLDLSSNGTWVNGRRAGRNNPMTLAVGDLILLLPASHVGRTAEIGYMLVHDARGAQCCGSQRLASAGLSPAGLEDLKSFPVKVDPGAPGAAPAQLSKAPACGAQVPRALEHDLRCGICADPFHQCLTLVPCGHNFCTCCLLRWRRVSHTCPECRAPVQQAVHNFSVDRIVESFLRAHPDAARAPEELEAITTAEGDPQNKALLRWLLREGAARGELSPALVPMPQASDPALARRRAQDQAYLDSRRSSVCTIS